MPAWQPRQVACSPGVPTRSLSGPAPRTGRRRVDRCVSWRSPPPCPTSVADCCAIFSWASVWPENGAVPRQGHPADVLRLGSSSTLSGNTPPGSSAVLRLALATTVPQVRAVAPGSVPFAVLTPQVVRCTSSCCLWAIAVPRRVRRGTSFSRHCRFALPKSPLGSQSPSSCFSGQRPARSSAVLSPKHSGSPTDVLLWWPQEGSTARGRLDPRPLHGWVEPWHHGTP